ncbi:peptidoglycan-binding protein [Streptomyces sp. NPDC058249]|uniref:peptidoglycan-binding domain-containing protein n=1 Tax=Streptomyces sp. NPDC058249 TaxID=3346403 RepID=UPI0036E728C9
MAIPPEPGQPARRPALEPTHVQRRRRSETLAELLRQVREQDGAADSEQEYESVPVPSNSTRLLPPSETYGAEEYETQELPPVPAGEGHAGDGGGSARPRRRYGGGRGLGQGAGPGRAAIAVAITAAALVGFALALLLPPGERDDAPGAGTRPTPAPTAQAPSRTSDPDGAGTLREGDSGPQVAELQERLLRIPDVYDNGATSGTYDPTLTAAVARFQLWYGIRGDETGVYGNDTRAALESRTTS